MDPLKKLGIGKSCTLNLFRVKSYKGAHVPSVQLPADADMTGVPSRRCSLAAPGAEPSIALLRQPMQLGGVRCAGLERRKCGAQQHRPTVRLRCGLSNQLLPPSHLGARPLLPHGKAVLHRLKVRLQQQCTIVMKRQEKEQNPTRILILLPAD